MTRKISVVVVLLLIVSFTYVLADSGDVHGGSIDDILNEIREDLGLKDKQKIDPALVDEQLLEQLGDAVMALNFPDPKQHEWMDEMMGGESSESLAAMHRTMGYCYLNDGSSWGSGGMMGSGSRSMMMGGGMMGSPNNWMMSPYYNSGLERKLKNRFIWGSIVPWTITGVLSATVAILSVVIARQ